MTVSDHDMLVRLDEKMDTIIWRLDKVDVCQKEQDFRVSKLESFQGTVLAFAGAVSLAASIAGSWVLSHFKVT